MAAGYELLDAGDGRRLERFGPVVVDRPAPGATGGRLLTAEAWSAADGRFDRDAGWRWQADPPDEWTVELDGLTFALRPAEAGQVGLFPEQAAHWPWLAERPAGAVLNLFAYTGATTLALARAGNPATHVDASRTAVSWARDNASRNDLGGASIRWIVDDVGKFVAREARRIRRYQGAILDPPSYGHGPRGQTWRIARDLPALVERVQDILEPEAWLLLTSHTAGLDLGGILPGAEPIAMELHATSGATLAAGHYVRWPAT